MMNLGYSGPMGHPISISFHTHPHHLHHRHHPLPNPGSRTPTFMPICNCLRRGHQGPGHVPHRFVEKMNEKHVHKCVIFQIELARFLLGLLLFINVIRFKLIIHPHSSQEEFLQISTMRSHALTQ